MQIGKARDLLRSVLWKISGLEEEESCQLFATCVFESIACNELLEKNVIVRGFGSMLNKGLFTGENLIDNNLVGFMNTIQGELLGLPEGI